MANHAAQCLYIRNLEGLKTDHQLLTLFIKKSSNLAWSLANSLPTFAVPFKWSGFLFEIIDKILEKIF